MKGGIFQNTVIFIPVNKTKLVPLRFQFSEGSLAFIAEPNKGEMAEEEALDLIESFHQYLNNKKIPHRSMIRNTEAGERIDMVVISLPKK